MIEDIDIEDLVYQTLSSIECPVRYGYAVGIYSDEGYVFCVYN